MGCILCAITDVTEFPQGDKLVQINPFYCSTKQDKDDFLEELAYDIAKRHPDVTNRINHYTRKLKRLEDVK